MKVDEFHELWSAAISIAIDAHVEQAVEFFTVNGVNCTPRMVDEIKFISSIWNGEHFKAEKHEL